MIKNYKTIGYADRIIIIIDLYGEPTVMNKSPSTLRHTCYVELTKN